MIQLKHKDLERWNKATEKLMAPGKYGPKGNKPETCTRSFSIALTRQ